MDDVETGSRRIQHQPVIDLLIFSLEYEFMKALAYGAQVRAASVGVDLRIRTAHDATSRQLAQVQAAVDAGVDAIILSPNDSAALVPAALTAAAHQIPLLTVDGILARGPVCAHVGFKNAAGGAMAARYLATQRPHTGHVLELQGAPSEFHAQQRSIGFRREMRRHAHLTVTSTSGYWRGEDAYHATVQAVTVQRDLCGIFAHNDEMMAGALQALEEYHPGAYDSNTEHIMTVAIDCAPPTIARIRSGAQDAAIQQDPIAMGSLAVSTARAVVQGHQFRKLTQLRPTLVTSSNVDAPTLWAHVLPHMMNAHVTSEEPRSTQSAPHLKGGPTPDLHTPDQALSRGQDHSRHS